MKKECLCIKNMIDTEMFKIDRYEIRKQNRNRLWCLKCLEIQCFSIEFVAN